MEVNYPQNLGAHCESLICSACEIVVEEFTLEVSKQAITLEKQVENRNNQIQNGGVHRDITEDYSDKYIDDVFSGFGVPLNGFCSTNKRISLLSDLVFDVCDQFNDEVRTYVLSCVVVCTMLVFGIILYAFGIIFHAFGSLSLHLLVDVFILFSSLFFSFLLFSSLFFDFLLFS